MLCMNFPDMTNEEMAALSLKLDLWSREFPSSLHPARSAIRPFEEQAAGLAEQAGQQRTLKLKAQKRVEEFISVGKRMVSECDCYCIHKNHPCAICDLRRLILLSVCVSDHICTCGTANHTPHEIGKDGCVRYLTEAPALRPDDHWFVDDAEITDYTLRQQRGYYQHDCGCWSRWPGTDTSIEA